MPTYQTQLINNITQECNHLHARANTASPLFIFVFVNRLFGHIGRARYYLPMALWSFCAGGRRFAPRSWHYSRGSFSSNQATGKVFSTENAIYSEVKIYLDLVSVGKL